MKRVTANRRLYKQLYSWTRRYYGGNTSVEPNKVPQTLPLNIMRLNLGVCTEKHDKEHGYIVGTFNSPFGEVAYHRRYDGHIIRFVPPYFMTRQYAQVSTNFKYLKKLKPISEWTPQEKRDAKYKLERWKLKMKRKKT